MEGAERRNMDKQQRRNTCARLNAGKIPRAVNEEGRSDPWPGCFYKVFEKKGFAGESWCITQEVGQGLRQVRTIHFASERWGIGEVANAIRQGGNSDNSCILPLLEH